MERLVLLGVGNGNDVDLPTLVPLFRSTTLVDVDAEAIAHCRSGLPAGIKESLDPNVLADLTGMLGRMPKGDWDAIDWNAWLIDAANPPHASAPQGDVVVSTCLISQLIDTVIQWLPPDHDRFADAILAVRDGHLRLLAGLAKAGGTSVLITDVVSSDTLPELADACDDRLPTLVRDSVASRNFFTGLNPAVLMQRLAAAAHPSSPSTAIHGPWRWRLGPRTFAVIGITMETKSADGDSD
ncbi:hypothetical protein [Rubripirellula tenax]|uniref:hypothetical protein n=1 Tax=Rubripirellula tenax TaxID=2528015 RepID=UPI0011B7B9FC|nr:hypothetical protein [Rubripirellula tenax]